MAVKVLCGQNDQDANFEGLSEYLVSKQVRHPNVVRPRDPSAYELTTPAIPKHSALHEGRLSFEHCCHRARSVSMPVLAVGTKAIL